ncbi:glyoxalase superfamily protein [Curtobacterium sp. L1-20]|uniref:glyoxalase superfamily protein n=1 Tax=Curtobacterium sp. L1-20 TaxID=3138181 RepID=UPI003B5300A5
MITIEEAKKLARELSTGTDCTHSAALEAAAHAAGYRDWNTMSALARREPPVPRRESDVIPVLRVFDHVVARAFYCDYLGFEWQWQHQFEADLPVYAQVALGGKVLHLSEHHGDATPGAAVMLVMEDLDRYRDALLVQQHPRSRPGIETDDWGRTMLVLDPFGNRLTFWQRATPSGRGLMSDRPEGSHER